MAVINYYRNIWPRRSHTLAYLIKVTSIKNKFKWTNVEQYTFKKIKPIVACNTSLTYPYCNETFKIFTDDSVLQLRAVIS